MYIHATKTYNMYMYMYVAMSHNNYMYLGIQLMLFNQLLGFFKLGLGH